MTVLVGMKLLRQFAIKLGELIGLHLMHARNQHIDRRIQELVHDVYLFALQWAVCRTGPQIGFHRIHRSFVYFLLNRGQTIAIIALIMRVRIKPRMAIKTLPGIKEVVFEFFLHFFSGLSEHLLLHLRDILALLLFLLTQFLFLSFLLLAFAILAA